jgi:hypothetical protein
MELVMVRVRVAEEATSGFANMMGQLVRQNLDESAKKSRSASHLRGRVAMVASDRGYAVTLVFDDYGVTILDGEEGRIDARIVGPYDELIRLAQGTANPLIEHIRGRLKVRSRWRRPFLPLRVHGLLKVDEEKEAARASARFRVGVASLAALAGAAGLLGVAAWLLIGVL